MVYVLSSPTTMAAKISWYCALFVAVMLVLSCCESLSGESEYRGRMVQLQIDDDHMEYMPCDEIYVVREGETLQTITEKCGDPYIVDENPHIDDSDDVFPGLDYDSDDGGVGKLATLHVSGKDSEVEFVLDVNVVLVFYLARVFPTPPRSSCCLPFSTVLLGNFPELLSDGWLLSRRLSFVDGCAQVASMEVMIGGGWRIGWLADSWIGSGEHNGWFSDVLLCLGFFSMFSLFLGSFFVCLGIKWAFICFVHVCLF
ncbi:hypothetical protein ACFX2I_013758 [Malus domestica]